MLATPTNITAGTITTVSGNVNGSVGSVTAAVTVGTISANVITASALATDAVNEIADGVWDEALSGHTTAGTSGKALSDAGAAGDPWSTALPGAYGAGTAGKILSRIPDVAAGASGGVFIAGANADATVNVTGNITGNLSGSVGSVTGAVGSVTGAVGSVTVNVGGNVTGSVGSVVGAVGSVTGNVGGNVTGSCGFRRICRRELNRGAIDIKRSLGGDPSVDRQGMGVALRERPPTPWPGRTPRQ